MKMKRSRVLGMTLGMVLVLGGFGYLLYGNIGDNIVYFLSPGELLAKGEQAYDAPVRLGGQVVPGTVQWNADALDLSFRLQDEDGDHVVLVKSKGAPPAMFREGQGVVVEGRLARADGSPVFQSTNLMVRHSNEYQPPTEGHPPEAKEMYKSLVKDRS
ncbi:MAG TPA: cytochrome c maturation protein CcmE [Longimicrobiales bacterium]|nr:cytochrome c maturation protein CcmE [Longimicrobiales bacterium]